MVSYQYKLMSRIIITPKTVNGSTATQLEVRIVMYQMDASPIKVFYAYYDAQSGWIAEGYMTITNNLSSATKTGLTTAVTSAVGSVDSSLLYMNDLYSPLFVFGYVKSGLPDTVLINGNLILSSEYDAIKTAVLTALGLIQTAGIGSMAIGSTFIVS